LTGSQLPERIGFPQALAGAFLHQSGTVFVNAPYEQVERLRFDWQNTAGAKRWSDLMPALAIWHELDHFCAYLTSPYFHSLSWILELQSYLFAYLWGHLQRQGFDQVEVPVYEAFMQGRLSEHAAWAVEKVTWVGSMCDYLLKAHPWSGFRTDTLYEAPPSFADRFNELVELALAMRGSQLQAPVMAQEPKPDDARFDPHISPLAILEASAMFHESGNVATRLGWSAHAEWLRERVTGIYGLLFPTLFQVIDIDIIGVLLKFSMRGELFPFREARQGGGRCARLESSHPSFVLAAGLRVLEEEGMFRAPAHARRSEDAANEFYSEVATVLEQALGIVSEEAAFAETDRSLDQALAEYVPLRAQHEQYQRFSEERSLLNVKRKRIFDEERQDAALLFSRPTENPMRIVYLDSSTSDPLFAGRGLLAHDELLLEIGVGEAMLFGRRAGLEFAIGVLERYSPEAGELQADAVIESTLDYFGLRLKR